MIKVYYRLSNASAGVSKHKIKNATKKYCLENCIKEFGDKNIVIVALGIFFLDIPASKLDNL